MFFLFNQIRSVQKGGLKVLAPYSTTRICTSDGGKARCLAHSQEGPVRAPWTLTFDLRERETTWTDENKVTATTTPSTTASINSQTAKLVRCPATNSGIVGIIQ